MIQVRPELAPAGRNSLRRADNPKPPVSLQRLARKNLCVDDDVEDIFGHILQYLHSGDYSVLVPAADQSSHVACEDEIDIATQDLLPLKENYFASHTDIQVKSDNSISLPHCGDGSHLCTHPKTLLVHARLYDFAARHGLEQLRNNFRWIQNTRTESSSFYGLPME
ncbi:hypothetical protein N7539_004073 [Penicillium diatomitis]|uniref:Uncharacterized protein n=1 Tax=Penicillium diatomitis TaxID=2819901 RepID=A0A9W9XDS6_9EURO|nr:uncharacterized protein N7539_004073 [Penicillium diatomitis]KAJ5489183.1 hypothetical protein N7539_004073 [Penicillium diatomitis]